MRALLPVPSATEVDIHEWYAEQWVDHGGLRVNFVASVDGASSASGRSAGLQTPGDNRIFDAIRDLADVVLVGAGTAVAEGYRAIRVSPERAAHRRRFGLPTVFPTALVSRSLRLDPAAPLFREAPDDARTIVITRAAAEPDMLGALRAVADVIICGDDEVDLAAARAALTDRGLRRIVCEGGPSLFGDLVASGQVDELCLSITPFLVGPGPARITGAGAAWESLQPRTELRFLLEEADALFARYAVRPE